MCVFSHSCFSVVTLGFVLWQQCRVMEWKVSFPGGFFYFRMYIILLQVSLYTYTMLTKWLRKHSNTSLNHHQGGKQYRSRMLNNPKNRTNLTQNNDNEMSGYFFIINSKQQKFYGLNKNTTANTDTIVTKSTTTTQISQTT